MRPLTLLYRGPLSSCNYGCGYCPFAKRHESEAEHAADAAALERFVGWCLRRTEGPLSVFFTPWGEALTQRRYQQAMVALSHAPHLEKVAVQTNLSASLDWLEDAAVEKLGLWCTCHPEWTSVDRFLGQCRKLLEAGVRFSVGVVGMPAHLPALAALRRALPPEVYVWVNAVKRLADAYTAEELAAFTAVDPHFQLTLRPHPSQGLACRGGEEVLSVDGEGTARRCHFVKAPLGNLYQPGFEARALRPRPCPSPSCDCHIGYVHLRPLGLEAVYGDGLLERIPVGFRASATSQP